jgi:Ran GTPase-activating protein (RanGAP) involved in mRNA processing and transport
MRDSGLGTEAAKAISEALMQNRSFATIVLSRNPIGDVGAKAIAIAVAKNTAIVHLDMSSNDLSSDGLATLMKSLTNHQSLISLDISSHEGLHRNRLLGSAPRFLGRVLASNKFLTILNVGGTSLGRKGLKSMLRGLIQNKTLLSLNLS